MELSENQRKHYENNSRGRKTRANYFAELVGHMEQFNDTVTLASLIFSSAAVLLLLRSTADRLRPLQQYRIDLLPIFTGCSKSKA